MVGACFSFRASRRSISRSTCSWCDVVPRAGAGCCWKPGVCSGTGWVQGKVHEPWTGCVEKTSLPPLFAKELPVWDLNLLSAPIDAMPRSTTSSRSRSRTFLVEFTSTSKAQASNPTIQLRTNQALRRMSGMAYVVFGHELPAAV